MRLRAKYRQERKDSRVKPSEPFPSPTKAGKGGCGGGGKNQSGGSGSSSAVASWSAQVQPPSGDVNSSALSAVRNESVGEEGGNTNLALSRRRRRNELASAASGPKVAAKAPRKARGGRGPAPPPTSVEDPLCISDTDDDGSASAAIISDLSGSSGYNTTDGGHFLMATASMALPNPKFSSSSPPGWCPPNSASLEACTTGGGGGGGSGQHTRKRRSSARLGGGALGGAVATDSVVEEEEEEQEEEEAGGVVELCHKQPQRRRRRRGMSEQPLRQWDAMTAVATPFGYGIVLGTRRPHRQQQAGAVIEVCLSHGKAFLQPSQIHDLPPRLPLPPSSSSFSSSSSAASSSSCSGAARFGSGSEFTKAEQGMLLRPPRCLACFPHRGAKGAVELGEVDLLRCEPEVFLNDNLIDFYLKFLYLHGPSPPAEARKAPPPHRIASTSSAISSSIADIPAAHLAHPSQATQQEHGGWPAQRSRFYFFNQFFFSKLSEGLAGGGLGAAAGAVAKQRALWAQLQRWTRSEQDLLAKDFLVVPVNALLHWSVAIVCNPGKAKAKPLRLAQATRQGASSAAAAAATSAAAAVASTAVTCSTPASTMGGEATVPTDTACAEGSGCADGLEKAEEEVGAVGKREEDNTKLPCIIFLDSAKLHRSQAVFRYIRKYLELMWIETRLETHGPRTFDAETMPGFSPKVPQQMNDCDCGVYMLHFVEKFCSHPPDITREFVEQKGNTKAASGGAGHGRRPAKGVGRGRGKRVSTNGGVHVEEAGPPHSSSAGESASVTSSVLGEFPVEEIAHKRRAMKALISGLANQQLREEQEPSHT